MYLHDVIEQKSLLQAEIKDFAAVQPHGIVAKDLLLISLGVYLTENKFAMRDIAYLLSQYLKLDLNQGLANVNLQNPANKNIEKSLNILKPSPIIRFSLATDTENEINTNIEQDNKTHQKISKKKTQKIKDKTKQKTFRQINQKTKKISILKKSRNLRIFT